MATSATSTLVFPSQANHNFSQILSDLKRSNLSITNRLRSIHEDAEFVKSAASAFADRAIVANERCGSWYVRPEDKAGSAYFKSTDGHTGQWRFSTRRLNLQLLGLIGERDGCVVVDSTRRGKRMPDALSKTVPIWCCVLNRVLFPDIDIERDVEGDVEGTEGVHTLFTPPNAVFASEHAQIEARIPEHVDSLLALGLDLDTLRGKLKKPLRPIWVTQESQLPIIPTDEVFEDFHPIICCTSSRRVEGGEMSEGGYIQGAGDDTENWALGLTPPVFWHHANVLLNTPESDLPDLIRSLVSEGVADADVSSYKEVAPSLFVGCLPLTDQPTPATCTIAIYSKTTDPSSWVESPNLMEVGVGKHKLASRNLRLALPAISDFVTQFLSKPVEEESDAPKPRQILVVCETGKDISIGVALALLCQHFDSEGNLCSQSPASSSGHTKSDIRVKLSRIMTRFPEANPSRATLQSVNSFLMG